jgi:signal transduction histidine kinase
LEPIGPSDLEEWASRTPAARWRTFDHATYQTSRIPVLGRNRRMLGWIESTDTVGTHHVGPNLVRTSPFVGTLVMVSLVIFLAVERRRAEERERVLRTAAVEEAASRAKSAFLLRLNRDLHPPLAALAGHAMRLQVRATTGAARRHLDAIRQQSAHLLHIADDLLDLGAIESGSFSWKPHAADVATLLHETIEPFDARAGAKGLTLSCEITSDVPDNIAIDATRFRQVATNLIGNAIKFTERGAVRVTLQIRTCADRTTMLELAVMDTGPGIAPADRVRLFEPFSRLAPTARKTGTGLGLALSAAICRRAGGALAVESDGRSGSCFRATFSIGGHAFPPQP